MKAFTKAQKVEVLVHSNAAIKVPSARRARGFCANKFSVVAVVMNLESRI